MPSGVTIPVAQLETTDEVGQAHAPGGGGERRRRCRRAAAAGLPPIEPNAEDAGPEFAPDIVAAPDPSKLSIRGDLPARRSLAARRRVRDRRHGALSRPARLRRALAPAAVRAVERTAHRVRASVDRRDAARRLRSRTRSAATPPSASGPSVTTASWCRRSRRGTSAATCSRAGSRTCATSRSRTACTIEIAARDAVADRSV